MTHEGRTTFPSHPGKLRGKAWGPQADQLCNHVGAGAARAPGRQVTEVSAAAGGGLQGGSGKAGFWLLKEMLLQKSFCI